MALSNHRYCDSLAKRCLMSGRRLYFGLFKISSLLALIPANPDAAKKFSGLICTNVTIRSLHPLEKWFLNWL